MSISPGEFAPVLGAAPATPWSLARINQDDDGDQWETLGPATTKTPSDVDVETSEDDPDPDGDADSPTTGYDLGLDEQAESTAREWIARAREELSELRGRRDDDEGDDPATASTARRGDPIESALGWIKHPAWPDREELINVCRDLDTVPSMILLVAGVVYSVMGYGIFKILAIANVAAMGAFAGYMLGRPMDAGFPTMIIAGVLAAAVAWPLFKWSLALSSGLVGFAVGVAVWRAMGMEDLYAPAGGLIGGIFLFMLCFILFELTIMAMAAIQGTIMLLAGLGGLLLKYPEVEEPVIEYLNDFPVILPVLLLSLSLASIFYQQHSKRAADEKK